MHAQHAMDHPQDRQSRSTAGDNPGNGQLSLFELEALKILSRRSALIKGQLPPKLGASRIRSERALVRTTLNPLQEKLRRQRDEP